MASAYGASYFQRISIPWMAFVTLFMGYFTWMIFWPAQFPYEQLGPLGSFAQYMVKNHDTALYRGFWIVHIAHLVEGFISLRQCSTKGITDSGARMKWFIQCSLCGIVSLSLLFAYKPGKKRR